ncbi:unnamed protein product [Phyllotreta striolata]|uniref:separase n=1 Tax=Phyllotreta striolata TaxID=444603 RepID=A0A9N9TL98_PHYSR|nr:unnamed protein product [Phyllotreta striolata]
MNLSPEEALTGLKDVLKKLENVHLMPSYSYKMIHGMHGCNALTHLNDDEIDIIYHLTETHSPGLRNKTVHNYEKMLAEAADTKDKTNLPLCKETLAIKCATYPKDKNVAEMLQQVKELPEEWTIVQLTPQYNPLEQINMNRNAYYTNALNLTVFNSGDEENPFFITIPPPKNHKGGTVELSEEIMLFVNNHKEVLLGSKNVKFDNLKAKMNYYEKLKHAEDNLKWILSDIQDCWLKEWKCLFAAKFCDKKLEHKMKIELRNFFKQRGNALNISSKIETILIGAIKNFEHLKVTEINSLVKYCLPEASKELIGSTSIMIKDMHLKFLMGNKLMRYPIILILHEALDAFPWEMLAVLKNQPTSRVPSLHFLYCLYKEHESDIIGGYRIINNYDNGSYVVNPGLDLKKMENRMMSFFNYWTPKWKGVVGVEPKKEEFLDFLTNSSIFSYNGHGSGSFYVSLNKLQKSHIKAVVLLFGCSSVKLTRTDPLVDMYGHYYIYLMAGCPCAVGMLWEVTDLNTDCLSTDFMSYFIPSPEAVHWKYLDLKEWKNGKNIDFSENTLNQNGGSKEIRDKIWEPDLLLALIKAKNNSKSFLTKAACVTRGLPVKIVKK